MTSLFQARRSAEEFAAVVDGDAESRGARGQESTTLLALVASLRDQSAVEPRAEFARDLRSRLMLEAETALKPAEANLLLPVRPRGRRERRLVAAASAFVLIGGTTTMAAAAQSALPGDALYPIKRGIEQAQAGMSMSDAGKGRDLLSQASDRLLEVKGLVRGDSVQSEPRVPETLEAFRNTATEGSTLLFESFRKTGDPDAIVAVRSFTAEGIATLEALASTVPADAQDEMTAAAILLHDIDSEATALCGSCAAQLPLVEVPDILLARAEVDRALALASSRELGNDHPVVVPKGTLDKAADEQRASAPTPAGPSDGPTDGPATNLPAPTLEPEEWPEGLLPTPEGTATGKKSGGQTSTEKLVEDLGSGLTGAVETILPDPNGGLLD